MALFGTLINFDLDPFGLDLDLVIFDLDPCDF